MFRIAKNIVKTFEQGVSDTISSVTRDNNNKLDAFFQSIPPHLIAAQFINNNNYNNNNTGADTPETQFSLPNNANELISGLRIIYVEEWQLQLQSFFDYIVGINDIPLPMYINNYGFMYPDYNAIINLLNDLTDNNNSSNNQIKLNIWSAKGGNFRIEYLSLSLKDDNEMDTISLNNNTQNNNNQNNNNNNQNNIINIDPIFQSLGIKVQWTPLIASTFTYHILQLNINNGPAQSAGLIPDEDYIIGCQDGLLATGGNELLSDVIRSRTNNSLVLYVYNKVSDSVRPITVNIGPDGRLGCNIGYGFLHRIPSIRYQDNSSSSHFVSDNNPQPDASFIPSAIGAPDSSFVPSAIGAPPQSTRKVKKHAGKSLDMNEYFNEGKDQRTYGTPTGNTPEVSPPPMSHH